MDKQLLRYESYARGIRLMLLFSGLWPGRAYSRVLGLVVIVHLFTALITSSAVMNFVINHLTDVKLATKGLGVEVSFLTTILKITIFVINRDNLVGLHEILEKTFRKDLENDELRPILLSPLNFFYQTTLYYALSTLAVVPLYFMTPPLSISMQLARGVRPINYRLPMPGQYPWTIVGNNGLYLIHYIIELCGGSAVCGIAAATDGLFGFYIFKMASQFRTLSYRLTNLKASDDHSGVMKECALRYQTLTDCRDRLERIYGPIVLWMLTTSALTMCVNIFQATQISFGNAVLIMVHIATKLVQTLLYALYGLFLTTESEDFRQSVYSSGWPGSGERSFMSNVLIMLMYKPLALTACHFSTISLEMFTAIMNTALSYFFLLRTLTEEQ